MTSIAALALATLIDVAPAWRARTYLTPGLEPPSRAFVVPMVWAGRIVTRGKFHVGVRTHWMMAPQERACAVTLQVTLSIP